MATLRCFYQTRACRVKDEISWKLLHVYLMRIIWYFQSIDTVPHNGFQIIQEQRASIDAAIM